jgi:large subunit ribosomal protein L3
MMGRMGIDTVTTQNLLVHSVDAENNKILVRGAVPGAIGATIFIRSAAKKAAGETISTKAGA